MLLKGMVLEASSDLAGAAGAFRAALPYTDHQDPGVRHKVGRAMVELAKVYAAQGRGPEAVDLADRAVELLAPSAEV